MTFLYFWNRKAFEIRNKSASFLNLEFFFLMNDDKIFFKNIMLILISNNFYLWIEELKDLTLKIKIWKYINSYDKIEESRKKVLSEYFILSSNNLISHHRQLLTISSQIRLISLLNLHNFVSWSIFLSWRLSNMRIIEQMWKITNEERSKSSKSLKKCST